MLINDYIKNIQKRFAGGISTEHSYRADLQVLISELVKGVIVTNEPKRQECGAPDYIIQKKDVPIGYIEAKDIGIDLDKTEKSEQLKRYLVSLDNLILTDYIEFRFYRFGEKTKTIKLAEIEKNKIKILMENFDEFILMITDFCSFSGQTIKSGNKLAKIMAQKARLMKDVIYNVVKQDDENNSLKDQLAGFRRVLITNLGEQAFADIYAQTIAYGLFAARLNDTTTENFSRQEALFLVPKSNPFLRKLFSYVAGPDLDHRVVWIVNDLADVFRVTDVKDIMADFGKTTQQNDPFLHFYETFLGEYDQSLRKAKGVYYTPEPVVDFIVRAVDDILRNDFKINDGLASTAKVEIETTDAGRKIKEKVHKIQILDPAAGTGTFLAEVVKKIFSKFETQKGMWNGYVENDLIPRLNGFEILMAPYTMCHLKIDMLLKETGYIPKDENNQPRLRVFLTNSLEDAHPDTGSLFASWLANEANEANHIKKNTPVMVVLGNPPYSAVSSNMKEWITEKIEDYKYVDGKHFSERKHWLQDDYVKFIRFGEHLIEKNKTGILAFINNHSFLDNPTFRGMRWHLLNTFDQIYIIDLHGNTKKKEVCLDGSKDENVFAIQQGVSINIFVKSNKNKTKSKLADVFIYDLFGLRENKYEYLKKNNLSTVKFKKAKYQEPYYFFTAKNYADKNQYNKGLSINELFLKNSTGIVTMGDSFIIAESQEILKNRINEFLSGALTENELKRKFNLGKNYAKWILENKNQINIKEENFVEIDYRPFDKRWTYYDNKLVWRIRDSINKNILFKNNYSLMLCRQFKVLNNYNHFFISNKVFESSLISNKTSEIGYGFPLYNYNGNGQQCWVSNSDRTPNLNNSIIKDIEKKINLKFTLEKEKTKNTFAPIDILDYIYAVLHSVKYREKYKEFLKIDFPRVPYPENSKSFFELAALGAEIRKLHLFEHQVLSKYITEYPIAGDNIITRSIAKKDFEILDDKKMLGRLWINDTQYFDKIPVIAFEYYIGGYQPAQKWLKDRKGSELSNSDISHYQKIIIALAETDRLVKEIDKIIEI